MQNSDMADKNECLKLYGTVPSPHCFFFGVIILTLFVVWQLYHHGENIAVNVHIANNSNRTVKKIKVSGEYTGTAFTNRMLCDAWQKVWMFGRNKERVGKSAVNVSRRRRRRRDFRNKIEQVSRSGVHKSQVLVGP
jgi:hypothetical protein